MIAEGVLALEYDASSEDIARTTHARVRFPVHANYSWSDDRLPQSRYCPGHSAKPLRKPVLAKPSTFRESIEGAPRALHRILRPSPLVILSLLVCQVPTMRNAQTRQF